MSLPCPPAVARNDNAAPTAGDVLIDWARRTPRRLVLADAGARGAPPRSWTCEALRDDAATLAVALLSRFAPGERIAVWAPPRPEGVVLQFAAAFAGLTLVAIDPACLPGELTEILDHAGAVGLFMIAEERRRAPAHRAARAVSAVREVVDLTDQRAVFAKRRCVDGLPEVRSLDPAQIWYAASGKGTPRGDVVLQRDLADTLRDVCASGTRRGDALLPCFPKSPPGRVVAA